MTHSASICHNRIEQASDLGLAFPILAALESFSEPSMIKLKKIRLFVKIFPKIQYSVKFSDANQVAKKIKEIILCKQKLSMSFTSMHSSCISIIACPTTFLYHTPRLPFHASLEKSSADLLTTPLIRWGCISSSFVFKAWSDVRMTV